MNIVEHFNIQKVARLDLSQYTRVPAGTTVKETVEKLTSSGFNCAFVVEAGRLKGVFTDRDVLTKVVDQPGCWNDPIETVMTPDPYTVGRTATAMDALRLMNSHHFRNVPVLGDDAVIVGNLTHFSLMRLADTLIRNEAALDESEYSVNHSFLFINFSGLMSGRPFSVTPEASIDEVIDTMRAESIGSILIVDTRGTLAGVFTERDLLTKIACRSEDLCTEKVKDYMARELIKLSPRDSIATGLHRMVEKYIRRLTLVSASDKPVGIISFRIIAQYMETSFSVEPDSSAR